MHSNDRDRAEDAREEHSKMLKEEDEVDEDEGEVNPRFQAALRMRDRTI